MQLISALFFWLLVFVIRLIPFRLLYVLSDFMAFVLHRVFAYRKEVVTENLKACFPEKDASEINQLIRLSYRNLSDILIEGIKGFSMNPQKDQKRYQLLNPELLEKYQQQHKDIMMVTGHYSNWEWGSLFLPTQMHYDNLLVLYKPLKNKYLDHYLRKHRERFHMAIRSMYHTPKAFAEFRNRQTIFTLVADQSPSNVSSSYWINFLGRQTAFLHGIEHYTRLYDLPLVYLDIQRKKRGFYELELSLLTEEPLTLSDGELTTLYARQLEKVIRQKPEDWLWSHKRWKHQPPSSL